MFTDALTDGRTKGRTNGRRIDRYTISSPLSLRLRAKNMAQTKIHPATHVLGL